MRTVNIGINELNSKLVLLGFVGENEHTKIVINCTSVFSDYPSAVPALTVYPPQGQAYPAVAGRDGNDVVWIVADSDLAHEGDGEIQLAFTESDVIVKSCIGRIRVSRSIEAAGEAPEPIDNWLIAANTALNAIPQTIDDALEDAKESGEFDGFSPIATVTKVGNTASISITDKEGTTTAQVTDGAKGDKGDPGDDGHSPVVTASKSGAVTTISVDGSPIATINDGQDGQDGEDGQDGYSPTATVAKSGNTATITITDKNGTTTAQISDGEKGDKGDPGEIPQETLDQIEGDIADLKANKAAIIVPTVSGSIASFPDGADDLPVKELTVGIEPVQDLHGYESPWPAGGGVNILDPNIKLTAGTYFGVTVTTTDGYNYKIAGTANSTGNILTNQIAKEDAVILQPGTYVLSGSGIAGLYDVNGNWLVNKYTNTPFTMEEPFFIKNHYWVITNGNTYNISTFMALTKGSTALTEWSPYSNVCPISGWTGCEVNRTGKNLLDPSALDASASNFVWAYRGEGYLFRAGVTYTLSVGSNVSSIRIVSVDESTVLAQATAGTLYVTYTPSVDTLGVIRLWAQGLTLDGLNAQLELGSTSTAYEPYAGSTYSITFPSSAGTVYGGTMTVNEDGSGELVVDRAMVDLGTLDYGVTDVKRFYNLTLIQGFVRATSSAERATGILCSIYKPSSNLSYSSSQDDCSWLRGATTSVFDFCIKDERYTSASDFKDAMSGVQLVYELATPVTYQLSNLEVIETLYGMNNVWADTGDSSVTYRADTKLYIDNKITQAIAAALNA